MIDLTSIQLLQFLNIVMLLCLIIPFSVLVLVQYLDYRRNKKIEKIHRFYIKEKYQVKDIREWDKYW